MDPEEDRRHSKRQHEHINMLSFVADSEYGIPKRCPCGGRLINEVRGKEDYDTLPGKRFFTCRNYEEAEQVMLGVSNLSKQIERLEEQVNSLNEQVYDLTVQVHSLEKRWGRVNAEVCRFVGCHETALKEQAIGQSENDVMKTAHNIYFNDYNVKFTLEHCWRELRFDQKWRSHSQPKEKMKEAGAEAVLEEEEVRPPGVKASKAAKRKKPNEAAYDHIHSILAEKNTISRQKILDRLLAKNIDTLSDNEVALKNKLSLKCFDVYCHGLEVTVLQVTGWKFRLLQVNLGGRYFCLFAV
uniref:Zinc finger GRF-type domain-containing protein n=1 Tax=Brassica oleracea var. oleracea TaxID=109376 RepID=A0A0D3CZC1_BRAOL